MQAESFKEKLLQEKLTLEKDINDFSVIWKKFKFEDESVMLSDNFVDTGTRLSILEDKRQTFNFIYEKINSLK